LSTPEVPDQRWEKLLAIWTIIERLRGESGCPWDRKQTPESVQTYLIEEAHEAAAAIRAGHVPEVAEELGDLLFMAFFIIYMYEQEGLFGLDEVGELICDKMIRRHPHVFGETKVETAREVRDNWEKIKANEKAVTGKVGGGIPDSLPALMRGYRMVSRLSHGAGSLWNDQELQIKEFLQNSQAVAARLSDGAPVSSGVFGRLLLDLVNLARLRGFQAELCLHDFLHSLAVP
jgi:MazG family protein